MPSIQGTGKQYRYIQIVLIVSQTDVVVIVVVVIRTKSGKKHRGNYDCWFSSLVLNTMIHRKSIVVVVVVVAVVL